jgi:hypothetical protein
VDARNTRERSDDALLRRDRCGEAVEQGGVVGCSEILI